jgi:hypothetical protein
MVSFEKDKGINTVMTRAGVRMKRIVKARDEAISKAFKGLF